MWSLSEYLIGLHLPSWWWCVRRECPHDVVKGRERQKHHDVILVTSWYHWLHDSTSGGHPLLDHRWLRITETESILPKREKLASIRGQKHVTCPKSLTDTRRVCPDFEIACLDATVFALALVLCGILVHIQDQWELAFSEYIWWVSGPVLSIILSHSQERRKLFTSK